MSGPKLAGITCDPEIIARNNERLRRIGKEAYYSEFYKDVNTDIANTAVWVKNYSISTIGKKVPDDYDDPQGILTRIEKLKDRHIKKIEAKKIDLRIIRKYDPRELNNIGCDKIREMPQWKQDFISEVSILLNELQADIKYHLSGIRQREAALAKEKKELEDSIKKAQAIISKMGYKELGNLSFLQTTGSRTAIPNVPVEKKSVSEGVKPFTLAELAIVDMFSEDIEVFSKIAYLREEDKRLIEKIRKSIETLGGEDTEYNMPLKRSTLLQLKYDYQILSKSVARETARRNTEREQRSTLELEYVSFCQALEQEVDDYSVWSLEKLEKKVSELKKYVEKQEERIYVEENIEEIMYDYGYTSISSVNLHDASQTSRIIFSDSDGMKIATSFGEGMVMMQVVGEGSNQPTEQEKEEQLKQQTAFCQMYPKIRKELEKRKIHIAMEQLAPPSKEYANNIVVDRQEDIHKTTRRRSFRHYSIVSENENHDMWQWEEPSVQYMED